MFVSPFSFVRSSCQNLTFSHRFCGVYLGFIFRPVRSLVCRFYVDLGTESPYFFQLFSLVDINSFQLRSFYVYLRTVFERIQGICF